MVAPPSGCPPNSAQPGENVIPTEILRRVARKAQEVLGPTRPGAASTPSPTEEPSAPTAPAAPPPTEIRPPVFGTYTAPGELTDLGVLFMPLAGYHGRELGAIGDALVTMGHRVAYLVEEETVEAVDPHLGDHPRILASKDYDRFQLGSFDAFVAMNDWGAPSRALYHLARVREVPSIAKVEGVQDFTDIDTGRIRLPYLAADHVLVQGANDIAALDRKNLHVVGNSNMELAWRTGPTTDARNGQVVINSNFTYGVLVDARDEFLSQAVAAILANDLEPVISQHPADLALPSEFAQYRTERSMSEMLPTCEAIITRFSTVPFEAIAYGTPFVYFNPHHEKVPTFVAPSPAFEHVHSAANLIGAIDRAVSARDGYRDRAEPYFRSQIEMSDTSSSLRSAEAIAQIAYPS